jgi:hypothetical protein
MVFKMLGILKFFNITTEGLFELNFLMNVSREFHVASRPRVIRLKFLRIEFNYSSDILKNLNIFRLKPSVENSLRERLSYAMFRISNVTNKIRKIVILTAQANLIDKVGVVLVLANLTT